ncbi:MAG TPA: tetratricopeptide repeat protein [Longimicrobiales bacterium]|nr:tetratricopeptide repeat protein [Longimicrobiales bacterium]
MTPLPRLFSELRQRHVFRVAGAYAAAAFVLVQVADLVVEPLLLPAWTMTLVIVLVVLGFPIALILSWALELTPSGIRRAPPSELWLERPARRRAIAGALALLAVIAAGGVIVRAVLRGARPDTPRSIAVLPFVDLSAGGDQRYFSEGLTEELTAALSRVDGLQVAARTAASQFGSAADLEEIGSRLRVTTVLEGSVRRAGDQLRVTARLVDVSSGYELWTQIYNRELRDVFAVQEDIAREILVALRFPETERRLVSPGTTDLAAYDHLLRGNYHLARRTPDEVRRAITEYRAAASADPRFSIPLFRQAYAQLVYSDWGWDHPRLDAGALLDSAAALIEQGLALEPASAEGWLARAYLHVLRDPFRMAGAIEAFERSLTLDAANPEAWHQYGQTLMVLGRYDDATSAYRRALQADPERAMTMVPLAAVALYRGRHEEAQRWADSAVAVDPANSYARASRARLYLVTGDLERGRAEAELAASIDQGHAIPVAGTLALALARVGARDSARARFTRALELAGADELSAVDASNLAMAALGLGDTDAAIALLRRARPRGAWFWFYLQSPVWRELDGDARFRQLVAAADPRRPGA